LKAILINGSPRKNSNTNLMLDAAAKELDAAGIEVERVFLADNEVKPCTACERCYKRTWVCPIKDDAASLLKKMAAADAVLIGSPVYFGGVTSQVKALMDRSIMGYNDLPMKGTVGGGITVGGGAHGGQELAVMQINVFMFMHQMHVAYGENAEFGGMGTGNDLGEVKHDKAGLKSAAGLGKTMASLMKRK